MMWALFIIVNIPVVMFIAWVSFHSKARMVDSYVDMFIAILKIIFIPRIVREILGMETDDAAGLIDIIVFVGVCAACIYGEYYLLHKYGYL
jgi:hypothetical protein